jgi:membrane protease YdiL (CAAX protease family)
MIYVQFGEQGTLSDDYFEYYKSDMDFEALGLSTNLGLITLILSFAIGLLALYLVIRFIHKRPFHTLINGLEKFRWNRIWFSLLVWGGINFILLLIGVFLFDDTLYLQFEWESFIPLLLICLFFLPLQTSFEELVFRGYYLQGIASLTKYPIIPVVATSLLFALAHMMNPEVSAYGWGVMFAYYFAFGFTLAVITIMDNGIEIALGMHAIHNIFSALTITYEEAVIETDAIWMAEDLTFNWLSLLIYLSFFVLLVYLSYRRFYDSKEEMGAA